MKDIEKAKTRSLSKGELILRQEIEEFLNETAPTFWKALSKEKQQAIASDNYEDYRRRELALMQYMNKQVRKGIKGLWKQDIPIGVDEEGKGVFYTGDDDDENL